MKSQLDFVKFELSTSTCNFSFVTNIIKLHLDMADTWGNPLPTNLPKWDLILASDILLCKCSKPSYPVCGVSSFLKRYFVNYFLLKTIVLAFFMRLGISKTHP